MASRRRGDDHGPVTTAPSTKKPGSERRQFWIAGLVLGLSLVAVTVIVSIASDKPSTRQDTQGQQQEQGGAKPHIIPLPNSGHEPESSGDRGGWEQIMTLGLIVAGVALVAVFVWRGTRKPRSGRQAWLAAAEHPDRERTGSTTAGSTDAGERRDDERAPPVGSAGG